MELETLRTIIVDDEEAAQNVLERLLNRLGHVDVLAKASNVDMAIRQILLHQPDLIFLDVQMPEKSGFDLVKEMKQYNLNTTIIFVTAHVEYALNALKVAAFDYLLKPVSLNDLEEAILRYRSHTQMSGQKEQIELLLQNLNQQKKLTFHTRTGYVYINPDEILYCEADVNYTTIVFDEERQEVVTVNIGKMENMLPSSQFFRLSRSHLINISNFHKADRKSKSCELIKNNHSFTLPVPKNQIRVLEDFLVSHTS